MDVDDSKFDELMNRGVKLMQYRINADNDKRFRQDLKYWMFRTNFDFKKYMKIVDFWGDFYRNI